MNWNELTYEPGKWDWAAQQVDDYEASKGAEANTLRETNIPILVMWTIGRKSGKLRKVPLMRVEHEGEYAIVASKGGSPEHPAWYHNLVAEPRIRIQDGPAPKEYVLREIEGDERATWWDRSVGVYPPYQEYQDKTDRSIPVLIATPTD
ncbi:UNVERIFIED_CONTAM: hypothetical protein GTU68_007933 [Idotea baltica]|nr:hypothetical protein [Idotea baltica]